MSRNQMSGILVTGGTGLVGSHLLMKLLDEGYAPTAIYRSKKSLSVFKKMEAWYKKPSGFFNRIQWIKADLEDVAELTELMQSIDVVFHAAAMVSFSNQDKYKLEQVNYLGTKQMVDLAIQCNVKEFYHVSSTAAIGNPKKNGTSATEESEFKRDNDQSNYAITKHLAELEVWRGMEEGLNISIVNPGIIIGPGIWGKSSTTLFQSIANGLKFYTKGVNGFVDVRDVADALFELFKTKTFKKRFLLIGENKSYQWVFKQIANQLKVSPPKFEATPGLANIAWRVASLWQLITRKKVPITKETVQSALANKPYDGSLIKRELGLEFRTMEKAITHTANCFKSSV